MQTTDRLTRIEEGGHDFRSINLNIDDDDDDNNKEIVLKLYIKKIDKSSTDYIFNERIPACDQMNFPGYTKRLPCPYYVHIDSYNDKVSTEKEDLNGDQKFLKITNTLLNNDVLKKHNVSNTDIEWIVTEMRRIAIEAQNRRSKLSDELNENPYKPPRTATQILNGESAARYVPPPTVERKEFPLDVKEGENPIISLLKVVTIMAIGLLVLPMMLIGFLLTSIYDTIIRIIYGKHKVTAQEKNWFEEIHRRNPESDTISIDKYIKDEISKVITTIRSKYPSIFIQFFITSENNSDEFIIAFNGKKKTDTEFRRDRPQDYGGAEIVGATIGAALLGF